MDAEFRKLLGVDRILADSRLQAVSGEYPHDLLVDVIRRRLEEERRSISGGGKCASPDAIVESVLSQLRALDEPTLRRVVNASGVVLHTNLGRAPLSREAIAAMDAAGTGFSNLEFNLDSGSRGSRHVHIEGLVCRLTGAEAALVVNNNAAAVMLGLSALARRKEVIVSRGQAVEIGGGFRIPDVMRQSGAKLVEVGTTNCTYARDFAEAVTPRTAALLRVHSSNFRVLGFTNEVALDELTALGEEHGLAVLDDLGSGCFLDVTQYGLAPEPTVQHSVQAGAALVFFSGDKLVGGPQAGIIAGKKQYVDKLKKHPLARAVRMDKSRLAGIAATLTHYIKGEAAEKIPVWRMIAAPVDEMQRRAERWAAALEDARIIEGESMVGGGSLPGGTLPTRLVALSSGGRKAGSIARNMAERLRRRDVPVIGRVDNDTLLLDPRTVLPEEDEIIIAALAELAGAAK